MAMTGGSFAGVKTSALPDLTKDAESFTVQITAGPATAQVVDPTAPQQALTAYNYSTNFVRGTIAFVVGTAVTPGASGTFIIPPESSVTLDFSDNQDDNAQGALNVIESVTFLVVDLALGVASATASAAALAPRGGYIVANFASS